MSQIYYKFKAAKDYSTLIFDGLSISVYDLKLEILKAKKLDINDFDVAIINSQTNEDYTDDKALIQRNTSVYVRRIPYTGPPRTTQLPVLKKEPPPPSNTPFRSQIQLPSNDSSSLAQTSFSQSNLPGIGIAKPNSLAYNPNSRNDPNSTQDPAFSLEINPGDPSEEAKIAEMFQQSSEQWDYQQKIMENQQPVFGSRQPYQGRQRLRPDGSEHVRQKLPERYICFRCGRPGHWIYDCPTIAAEQGGQPSSASDSKRVKRTTGIPKSFLQKVDKLEEGKHAMVTSDGTLVVATTNDDAWNQAVKLSKGAANLDASFDGVSNVPEHLLCKICNKIARDAVKAACCQSIFCAECIEQYFRENDANGTLLLCPSCNNPNEPLFYDKISPANDTRALVTEFLRSLTLAAEEKTESDAAANASTRIQTLDDLNFSSSSINSNSNSMTTKAAPNLKHPNFTRPVSQIQNTLSPASMVAKTVVIPPQTPLLNQARPVGNILPMVNQMMHPGMQRPPMMMQPHPYQIQHQMMMASQFMGLPNNQFFNPAMLPFQIGQPQLQFGLIPKPQIPHVANSNHTSNPSASNLVPLDDSQNFINPNNTSNNSTNINMDANMNVNSDTNKLDDSPIYSSFDKTNSISKTRQADNSNNKNDLNLNPDFDFDFGSGSGSDKHGSFNSNSGHSSSDYGRHKNRDRDTSRDRSRISARDGERNRNADMDIRRDRDRDGDRDENRDRDRDRGRDRYRSRGRANDRTRGAELDSNSHRNRDRKGSWERDGFKDFSRNRSRDLGGNRSKDWGSGGQRNGNSDRNRNFGKGDDRSQRDNNHSFRKRDRSSSPFGSKAKSLKSSREYIPSSSNSSLRDKNRTETKDNHLASRDRARDVNPRYHTAGKRGASKENRDNTRMNRDKNRSYNSASYINRDERDGFNNQDQTQARSKSTNAFDSKTSTGSLSLGKKYDSGSRASTRKNSSPGHHTLEESQLKNATSSTSGPSSQNEPTSGVNSHGSARQSKSASSDDKVGYKLRQRELDSYKNQNNDRQRESQYSSDYQDNSSSRYENHYRSKLRTESVSTKLPRNMLSDKSAIDRKESIDKKVSSNKIITKSSSRDTDVVRHSAKTDQTKNNEAGLKKDQKTGSSKASTGESDRNKISNKSKDIDTGSNRSDISERAKTKIKDQASENYVLDNEKKSYEIDSKNKNRYKYKQSRNGREREGSKGEVGVISILGSAKRSVDLRRPDSKKETNPRAVTAAAAAGVKEHENDRKKVENVSRDLLSRLGKANDVAPERSQTNRAEKPKGNNSKQKDRSGRNKRKR